MSSAPLHIVSPSPRGSVVAAASAYYSQQAFVQPKSPSVPAPVIKTEPSFIDPENPVASNGHHPTSPLLGAAIHPPGREEAATILGSTFYGCRLDSAVLERYQQLLKKETQLVQQLGNCDSAAAKNLGNDLLSVLNQKMVEIKALVGGDTAPVMQTSQQSPPHSPPGSGSSMFKPATPTTATTSVINTTNSKSVVLLSVEEQPTGNVVANKYLEPPLVVKVDESLLNLAREGKLQVTANLCLTLSEEVLSRTLDNKQDILQGHTQVPVTSEGYVTFNKLKIMEVSSKHHHQAFSIQLQLQEISNEADGNISTIPVGDSIKLAPLHVQSRINKRKRSCFNGHITKQRKRTRGESDSNYVDITSLLVLPQKEAATRLGISESMLCKRFKECTRRKWPYRYLRKIDKMIRVLTLNKKSDSLPKEDQEKIQRLKREREECLHPVKIRITGHDKSSTARLAAGNFSETSTGKSNKGSDSESEPTDSNSSPYEEEEADGEDEEYEEDEISQVASTLSLLKNRGY
jgi:hypothetical protein